MKELAKPTNMGPPKNVHPLGSGVATGCTDGMTVLDLFSGIGGFSLGLERAGMKTVAFCEIDQFCRKVLKKHWPDVPIFKDIREVKNVTADLVCGGYPCQPFSVAGNQKAEEDDRHLWPEMLRVITQVRPSWVIAENVYGHVKLGLDKVLLDSESEGYTARPFIIPACATGKPHRRDRIYIVAHSASNGRNESKTRTSNGEADDHCKEGPNKNSNHEGCSSLWTGMGRGSQKTRGWGTEPPALRVDDGLPNRMDRNRVLGNSLIPQIPELIGRAITALGVVRTTQSSVAAR